jgi:hypothetical protein
MIKFYKEIKSRKANGEKMRPIWQMIVLLPMYLLYLPARCYVDFMDTYV